MTQSPARSYLTGAETAKLIRGVLKANFPGVTFSVRKRPGGSIDVTWVDGPIASDVDKLVGAYGSRGFDGQIDGSYVKVPWGCPQHGARVAEVYGHGQGLDGVKQSRCCAKAELIRTLTDYVFSHRQYSPGFRAAIEDLVARQTGQAYDPNARVWDQYMSSLFHREASKTAAAPGGKPEVD